MYSMQDDRDPLARVARESVTRSLLDAQGNEWVVREMETPQPWAQRGHCLIFSSPALVRRVWSYPAGWAELPSRDLLELLGDTSPA
jgi:hypothetical protein